MSKSSIACVVLHEGKILIAHRNPVGQMGDRWEFPGGKVEAGETDAQTVVRECREEFGVEATVGEKVTTSSFVHNGVQVSLHAYEVFFPHDGIAKKYTLTEHSEYKWVSINDIPSYHFVDSDFAMYPEIKRYVEKRIGDIK